MDVLACLGRIIGTKIPSVRCQDYCILVENPARHAPACRQWKPLWKTVSPVAIPPAFAKDHQAGGEHKYFTAQGSFRSPAEIPAHFRNALALSRDAEVSELVRSYECEDNGFVREHR